MTRIRQRCHRMGPAASMSHRATRKSCIVAALALAIALLVGCGQRESRRVVNLWHQMRPEDRAVLAERIDNFESEHPGLLVRPLYKETEELRSGLVSAVLADRGPEVIYGPSDVLGVYQAMGALADMSPWLTRGELEAFDPRAIIRMPVRRKADQEELIFLGDRFGNHLGLVYNRKFIKEPPKTTDELVALAKANTVDEDGDGRPDRYGLVWNYTEPFFVIPFLTGHGGWIFADEQGPDGRAIPALDSPELVRGFEFVQSLVREHKVLPRSADYEVAASLFRDGKAAMIIDGDWSWQQYIEQAQGDAALATLPVVSSTNLPMEPMVAPKGYSLGSFAKGQAADDAIELIRFLTSEATQRVFLEKQRILPSRLALRDDSIMTDDPIMATSLLQAEQGRAMPTALEMRAVWDAMRPPYQLLMAGEIDAQAAAVRMQSDALMRIDALRTPPALATTQTVAFAVAAALAFVLLFWQRPNITAFFRDLGANRLAYAMVLPAMALIFLTVLYPLAYSIVLSFSNMSLTNLRDWDFVGLRNYTTLATGREASMFWRVFVKTIFWTVINVAFHVSLGVMLAVTLNGPLRGKSIYRVLLVIPWAVPAYITALTWRGMFDYEYGAVNHAIRALGWFNGILPTFLQFEPVNWLGQAGPAFTACIVANVWLGFPFMMVIALGGLQGIPAELYEAARMDRASRWQQFRLITLPMLRPVLAPAITLGAVWTFNNLNVVWLVSNGGEPADQTHILVSYVYKAVFNLYQYGYGAALSMVIFFTLLAFSLLFLNRTRATEAV
jgi:arabinogalactan oligomer/maltooligosaccharide transport system permease protein